MKNKQLLYESYNNINIYLTLEKTSKHLQSISNIKSKKIKMVLNSPTIPKHNIQNFNSMETYIHNYDNNLLHKKIFQNYFKTPHIKIDNSLKEMELRKLNSSKIYNKLNTERIKNENQIFFKRLSDSKSFFNAKKNDKLFEENHSKLLNNLKKIPIGKTKYELPKIKKIFYNINNNNSIFERQKLLFKKKLNKCKSTPLLKNQKNNNETNTNLVSTQYSKDKNLNNNNQNEFFQTAIKI